MSTDTAVATVPAVLIHPSPRGAHGVGLLPRPAPASPSPYPASTQHQISLCVVISCATRGKSKSKGKTPLLLDEMPEPMDRPFVSELGDMLEMGPT
jgi:hypothetical protein